MTSVVACILHDLGFYVVVYIGNGWHIGGMMVPFSGKRKRSSAEFYGRCVSQFVTITTPVRYVTDPDIMVFVTYPMTQKVFNSCLYNKLYLTICDNNTLTVCLGYVFNDTIGWCG